MSMAGWMPRASSRSSSSASRELARAPGELRAARGGIALELRLDQAQASASETRRCCAPSWRLRSRRRRSASPASTMRARERRELLVRVGVGQRLGDELGEVAQPPLGAGGEPLGRVRRGDQRAPEPAGDADRRRDRRAVAERAQTLGELAADAPS